MMSETLRRELERLTTCPVFYDEPMNRYTSMGVGGRADAVFFPAGAEELKTLIVALKERGIPLVPIGNGTNIIVKDGGYRGAVVSLKGLRRIQLGKSGADHPVVFAESGVGLASLVGYCAEESLTGLEFCAGIPGTVGGAVKMNAGAYGWEMKDVVEKVCLLSPFGEIRERQRDDLLFEYRKLHLAEDEIVIGVSFQLKQGDRRAIREEMDRIQVLRKGKHPLDYRSAGSIFKNPPGVPAGRLIDETGLKGIRSGDAQVSEKHGNFIVNLGHAKAADVLDLIARIKKKVFEQKGVVLETEVVILGENGNP